MVVTYGLTVMFWAACPWVVFATLGTNVVEMAGDANKLLRQNKRPLVVRKKDNEPWDTVFALLTHFSVFTNLGMTVFTCHQLDLPLRHRCLLFFALEHVYLVSMWLLSKLRPAMPLEVRHLNLKHQLIVKKHLDCIDDEDLSASAAQVLGRQPHHVWILDRDDEEDDVVA